MLDHPLESVGQLQISVTDLDNSIAFYQHVLGLPLLFTVPEQSMAFFDAGGVRLYLGVPEAGAFHSRPLVYYRVADVPAAFEAITGRGAVPMSPPHAVHRTETSELWMAFVADPDGIPIGLMAEVPVNAAERPAK